MSEETEIYSKDGSHKLVIYLDEDPCNPREWDNLSKIITNHKRYDFANESLISPKKYDSWDELYNEIEKIYEPVIVETIYMYDHSGITLSLSPFNCPWDSGRLGFIIVTKADFEKEFGITKETSEKEYNDCIKQALEVLKAEFKHYKHYAQGDVFLASVYKLEKYTIKGDKIFEDRIESFDDYGVEEIEVEVFDPINGSEELDQTIKKFKDKYGVEDSEQDMR